MDSKDREALIKKIEKYYREHKGKSLYFYPLAVLYCRQNEKEKAYQILLEGLHYYPRYVLALVKIAEILIEENKHEAALAYLETAISIQKYNTKALEYLALSYEKLDNYKEALEIYEKILYINPNNERIKSKVVELAPMIKPDTDSIDKLMETAGDSLKIQSNEKDNEEILVPSGDIDDKLEIKIDDIPEVDLEDENFDEDKSEEVASVTLARLYEKQGYIEDAIEVYKKVLEKESDNMEVLEALSRLEEMEKKNEEAD